MSSDAPGPSPADREPGGPLRASIVIPTRNRPERLVRCLEHLADQTERRFEVVLLDDGSTPPIEPAVRAAGLPPWMDVRVLRHEVSRGANTGRNAAIAAARGPVIAMLDDDCEPEPAWLARLLEPLDDPGVEAVQGLVIDPPPRTIHDRTMRGTHRVAGPGPARRLVSCNMAVRRAFLLAHPFDEGPDRWLRDRAPGAADRVAYRCDEENVFIALRRAGRRVETAPDARVLHVHHHDRASFVRLARDGGRSAAMLVHRYRLAPRLDMVLFMAAWLSLVPAIALGVLRHPAWLLLAAAPWGLALAAIAWNDVHLKGKGLAETLRTFPMLLVYYHLRLAGYVTEALRLRLGGHGPGRAPDHVPPPEPRSGPPEDGSA